MRRRGAREMHVVIFSEDPRVPVPVGRRKVRALRDRNRLVRHPDEAQTRRHHQALLTGRDHHIDAPVVKPELIAAERGDAIDREQRRVPRRVDRRAHRGNVVPDRGRRIEMRHEHRLDPMLGIGAQRRLEARGIGGRVQAEVDHIDLDPHRAGMFRPADAEPPGRHHQRLVPAREHVGDRRLPGAVTVRDVNRHMRGRHCNAPQVRQDRRGLLDDLALVDIRRGAVHRPQHPVGHGRGAGNGKIGAAVGEAHLDLL